MRVIGITGGIGSGKSEIMKLLQQHFNAHIIIADDVAKEIMKQGNTAYKKIVEIFGTDILAEDQSLDREKMGKLVFANKNKRIVLNSIVHPLVKKKILEETTRLKCEEKYDYIFVEAALMIEDHYQVICDEYWYVYAPDELRRDRLKTNRGYSDEKISEIFSSQLTEEQFRENCKIIIFNDKSIGETMSQLKKLLEEV